jgi:hypothetical protein
MNPSLSAGLQVPVLQATRPLQPQSLLAVNQPYLVYTKTTSSSSSSTASAEGPATASLSSASALYTGTTICPAPVHHVAASLQTLTKSPSQRVFQSPFLNHSISMGAFHDEPPAATAALLPDMSCNSASCSGAGPVPFLGFASTPDLSSLSQNSMSSCATAPAVYMEQVFSSGSMANSVLGAYNAKHGPCNLQLVPQQWQEQRVALVQDQLHQLPMDFSKLGRGFHNQGADCLGVSLSYSSRAQEPGFAPAGLQDRQVLTHMGYSAAACSQPFLLAYPGSSSQPTQAITIGYDLSPGVCMPLASAESLDCALGQLWSGSEAGAHSTPVQLSGGFRPEREGAMIVGAFAQGLHPCVGEYSLGMG